MGVPEQRYHAWMSVQLLIIVVIRRFDHGVLLIIRSQSDDRGRKLLLITRVLSLDEFSVPLLLATQTGVSRAFGTGEPLYSLTLL